MLAISGAILAAWGIYHGEPSGTRITAIMASRYRHRMLTLTGNTISMDAFGPISDNANGTWRNGRTGKSARDVMDDLDATGNTTKAITKGVAIGSAVIAALALYGSFFADVTSRRQQANSRKG